MENCWNCGLPGTEDDPITLVNHYGEELPMHESCAAEWREMETEDARREGELEFAYAERALYYVGIDPREVE